MLELAVKRIYEPAAPADGRRILVDRLWPRGVTKARAQLDDWMKAVGPSNALRRWFGRIPERWPEFRRRYFDELRSNPEARALLALAAAGPVILLYAARDTQHNEAVALAEHLRAEDQHGRGRR